MLKTIWGKVKSTWNAIPPKGRTFIKNVAHQTAHLAVITVEGIKNSIVGHGLLLTCGWHLADLALTDITSDLIGTALTALPFCTGLLIYHTIRNQDTLKDRDAWLKHAIISILPMSTISFASSMLGATIIGKDTAAILHAGAANGIGTLISVPTSFLVIFSLKQFSHMIMRRDEHHQRRHGQREKTKSFLKNLRNNFLHETFNIILLYAVGMIGSLTGLGLLYPSGRLDDIDFLKIFLSDLTGISIITIPLGTFYMLVNTFLQKEDAIGQRHKWARHSALRLLPTTVGMPIMTILGSAILYSASEHITLTAAANGCGIILLSFLICSAMTITNKTGQFLHDRNPDYQHHSMDVSATIINLEPMPRMLVTQAPVIYQLANPNLVQYAVTQPILATTAPLALTTHYLPMSVYNTRPSNPYVTFIPPDLPFEAPPVAPEIYTPVDTRPALTFPEPEPAIAPIYVPPLLLSNQYIPTGRLSNPSANQPFPVPIYDIGNPSRP